MPVKPRCSWFDKLTTNGFFSPYLISGLIFFFSCADYNLLNNSLHPASVTLQVTAVSDSTVSLLWTQYDSVDFKNYKVYYSRNDVVETTDSLVDSLIFSFDTTKIVTRLSPGTLYYFRVMMNTTYGTFSASNIVQATTTVHGSGSIRLFNADSVTDSTIVLRWTRCASAFDRYQVFTDTTSQVNTSDTLVASIISDTFIKFPVKNFKSNKDYWFKVYAQYGSDTTASSNTVEVHTLAILSKPKPVNVQIAAATDSSVTLRWTQYAGADFKNYRLYYAQDDGFTLGDTLFTTDSLQTDTLRTVRPLGPETNYFFRVIVTTQSGQSSTSNTVDTATLIRKNGVLTWFKPDTITDSTVTLRWSNCTLNFDHYRILADTSSFGMAANILVAVPGKDTVATIRRLAQGQNLAKGHEYWFRVDAIHDSATVVASSSPLDVIIEAK